MKISEYVYKYTKHNRIGFKSFLAELGELLAEVLKLNKNAILDEFSDVILFLQAWLWSEFKIDGELWSGAKKSAKKFADREAVWQEIYEFVGLKDVKSGYVGNYVRINKVISHLSEFGVSREKAEDAYNKIVLKK